MTTIAEVATKALEFFTTQNKKVVVNEEHPDWVMKLVCDVHDEFQLLPNDLSYKFIKEALNYISEQTNFDYDDLQDLVDEWASNTSVYNHEILEWLTSNSIRVELADEAISEMGCTDIIGAATMGQSMERSTVYLSVLNSLESQIND